MDLDKCCDPIYQVNHQVLSAQSRGSFLYFVTEQQQMLIQQFKPQIGSKDNSEEMQYLINVNIYQNNDLDFNSLYIDQEQKYAFLGCFGQLVILDISNKLKIQQIAIIGTQHDFSYFVTVIQQQFVLLSNYYSNILVFDISDIKNPTFYRKLNYYGKESIQSYFFQKETLLYSISYFYCLQITNLQQMFKDKSAFQNFDEESNNDNTYNYLIDSVINSMGVSSDEKFLFLGQRSNGMRVYDISTPDYKLRPFQIQQIDSFGFSAYIQTAGIKDRYIIFSEGISLKIFEKTIPNTSQAILNIFNTNQCIYFNCFVGEQWPWDILLINDRFMVVSGGYTGFKIIDMINPLFPIILYSESRHYVSVDSCAYLPLRKLLLIGQSEMGIAFYDVSQSFNKPIFLKDQIFTINPDTDDFSSNSDETILAFVDEKSFGFINISNIFNMTVIDFFSIPPSESRSFEGISMDENFLYGCAALRNRGVYYFKFDYLEGSDPKTSSKKITIIKFVQLFGAESLRYDQRNNGIFYVADGVSGVTVLDASDKTKDITLIISVPVSGWVGRVFQPPGNLNILIVNHHDRGTISVMDISDRNTMQKIEELQFIQFSSFSSVTDFGNTFMAITVPFGIRICLTNTPIILHTQMSTTDSNQSAVILVNEEFVENINDKSDIVTQIGESVSFAVIPLYYSEGFQFIQLIFYDEFQQKDIPNWITFSTYNYMINLQPQKSLNSSIKNFYILLIQVSLEIYNTDFISASLNISSDISQKIYTYLIGQGILNQDGYLRSSYDSEIKIVIDWSDIFDANTPSLDVLSNVYGFITYTLNRSRFFYPISFKVTPSLSIQPNDDEGMIQTLSSQTGVYLQIIFNSQDFDRINNYPQFIRQQYQGVLSDITNNNQNLELKGIVASVNSILKNEIFIFSPLKMYSQLKIQVLATDDLNLDIQETFNLDDITMFKKKKDIQVSISLQSQYDQQFPNGLTVESDLSISIDAQTFITDFYLKLNYSAEILINNEWQNLTNQWIELDTSNTIELKGRGTLSMLQTSHQIKILASDQYETISQIFTIKFSIIPFAIILQYAGYALIIIFFIILLYCLRQKVHYTFFRRFFMHSMENVHYKNYYRRKIFLMQDTHQLSEKLIKLMKKEFIKNNKVNLMQIASLGIQNNNMSEEEQQEINQQEYLFLNQYLSLEGTPNMKQIMPDAYKISALHSSKFKQVQISEFNIIHTRLYCALNGKFIFRMLNQDKKTKEIFYILKKQLLKRTDNILDWYEPFLEVQYGCEQSLEKFGQCSGFNSAENIQMNMTSSKIKNDKLQISVNPQRNEKNQTQIQTPNSIFPSTLAAGKNNGNSMQTSIGNVEMNEGIFILPEVKLNEDAILHEIKAIYNSYENNQQKLKNQNSSEFNYNIHLLKGAIQAECQGFGEKYSPQNYKSSFGSVIHLNQKQIKNIYLFQKRDEVGDNNQNSFSKSCARNFRQLFGLDFIKIAQNFQQSSSFRSWLRFDITENYILLYGMPSKLNIGDYLIQIENQNRYVAHQFQLQIGKQKSELKNQVQKRKVSKNKEANKLQQSISQRMAQYSQQIQRADPIIKDKCIVSNNQVDITKIPSKFHSFDQKLALDGINISSFINLKEHTSSNKCQEDDIEQSNCSFHDMPHRLSDEKTQIQYVPQFQRSILNSNQKYQNTNNL